MTDTHIHIGQYEERYYSAKEVFEVIFSERTISNIIFTTTSSCIDDIEYSKIENEIADALSTAKDMKVNAVPFFWYVPDYRKHGLSVETAMRNLPYTGIKIHPLAHEWDLQNPQTVDIVHEICDYCSRHKLPVLVHTNCGKEQEAKKFSKFFEQYRQTNFILAHGYPVDQAIEVLRLYPNTSCDTAFMTEENFEKIIDAGFGNRLILGSDFPMSHYYSNKYAPEEGRQILSLGEQYKKDAEQMKRFDEVIKRMV
jgi:predicted TIM-barrel fold metal-dependent hydrolase